MSGRYECRIVSSFAEESVSTSQNYSMTRRVVRIGGHSIGDKKDVEGCAVETLLGVV